MTTTAKQSKSPLALALSAHMSKLGKKGAKARIQLTTAKRRQEIATKASKAAARARTAAAKARRRNKAA